MHSSNARVLEQVSQWLQQSTDVWLATVLATWGSSPRPAGSLLAYAPDHGLAGSLSGGCIEEDLLAQLAGSSLDRKPSIHSYGLNDTDQVRLALPCGGTLTILLEPLQSDQALHFQELARQLKRGHHITRRVDLLSGGLDLQPGQQVGISHTSDMVEHTLGPSFQLLLTGAGETTRCVAELARAVDFSVTVCDFRDGFLQGWQVDDVEVVKGFPDDLVRELFMAPTAAIIALAHDPRVDDMALMAAFEGKAFYIAAMGSTRTSASRRARLTELGVPPEQLARLHAPAGIATGSKTPWEIAISIVAQLTAERARLSKQS